MTDKTDSGSGKELIYQLEGRFGLRFRSVCSMSWRCLSET